jgi:6-phosphogluconolactonase
MTDIHIHPSPAEVGQEAGLLFCDLARMAIQRQGAFSVALSGGSTPTPLFHYLATDRAADILDWGKIHFFWADERSVPPHHPDSNYLSAQQSLLNPRAIPSENIHRIKGELEPNQAAEEYQGEILSWFGISPPSLDLILLGMGADGHTASLFPETQPVKHPENDEWVTALHVPQLDSWRITMTSRLINAASHVVVLVTGSSKASTLSAVLQGPFQPENYPIQLIKPEKGKLAWLVDSEAGSALEI